MITADGWCDWAIRMPGNPAMPSKISAGVNPCKGIFMHSAEGYATALLSLAVDGPLSWHASNLMDGRFVQHYSLNVRCHHATAANPSYIGVENEGVHFKETSLNEAQIDNAVRFIADVAAWKGWEPKRPTSPTDTTHTLWEHNEVVRLGGTSTACPSGRIPWQTILDRLEGDDLSAEDVAKIEQDRLRRLVIRTLLREDYVYTSVGQDPNTGEWIVDVASGVASDDALKIRLR